MHSPGFWSLSKNTRRQTTCRQTSFPLAPSTRGQTTQRTDKPSPGQGTDYTRTCIEAFSWHPFQFSARRQPVSACSGSPPQCSTFSSICSSNFRRSGCPLDVVVVVVLLDNRLNGLCRQALTLNHIQYTALL